MGNGSWVLGEGPLVRFAEGYRHRLRERYFSPRMVRGHVELLGQVKRWLVAEELGAADLTPARAELFFAARRAAGQRRVPTARSLVLLFEYLRELEVLPPERPAATPVEELLVRYRRYLVRDRGLAALTVIRYERMARRFLTHRVSSGCGQTGARA
jgi:hypothetical protein